jgi:hypothetical protein
MKKKPDKKHFQGKKVDGELWFRPYSENAKAKAAKYKHNQIVHFNPVGETDERSVKQLGLYWQSCKYVANNNDDPDWSTKDHVDFQVRMSLKFFDHDYIFFEEAKRRVHFKLRSISFVNLEHIDACGFFKEASEVMANKVSHDRLIPVDEFIEMVKASCKGGRR